MRSPNDAYLGSGLAIKASIKKYGKGAHQREILESFDSREEAFKHESEIVTADLLKNPLCMNLVPGGRGGFTPTDEVRAKLSFTSRNHSTKSKEKWKAANIGRKRPLETGKKISKALKGVKKSDEHRKNNGRAHSKPCTVDGVTIYPSLTALVKKLGWTKHGGAHSPSFRYVNQE